MPDSMGPSGGRSGEPAAARARDTQARSPRQRLARGFLALVAVDGALPSAVSGIDLSRTGFGFYWAHAVPVGAACVVTFRAQDGALVTVTGRVTRRRLVRGTLHEVGLRLDQPIDPSRFFDGPTPAMPLKLQPTPPVTPPATPSTPPTPPTPEAGPAPYERVADLADSMRRIAESQGPLDDLHAMVDELVKLCESVRLPDEDGSGQLP